MNRMYERSKELHHLLKSNPLKFLITTMKDLETNYAMFEKPNTDENGHTEWVASLDSERSAATTTIDKTSYDINSVKNSMMI